MRKYCCDRFRDAVKEKFIKRVFGYDDTKWCFNKGFHLYYCPFCGANITGWGEYHIDHVYTKTKDRK